VNTKKRVLAVDDEPGILRFVQTALRLAGFEVLTTTSGEEALELARSQNPDIVLLDILMQPLTGFEVLERLRAFSKVPVIVFTAHREVGEMALKEGANATMTKPFKPDDLVKKIRAVLDMETNPA